MIPGATARVRIRAPPSAPGAAGRAGLIGLRRQGGIGPRETVAAIFTGAER